ncbi:alpha-glucosidase [Sporolactobacillus shoreae]|uniref:Alpha-glucosidase n=1 Tax=Sporolactobacillus shoreae TaxID=1465501 RepID=A0A4Z0GLY1_9BACL|nr:alpha-glucosidase [Sporolactobacillus shoreae]TGA97118.1 alpha-glucosidase [Sporolactobacillus shoreae]
MDIPWWHQAIVYQIYPKSFKDTNSDGEGDIQGIIEKLDYLQSLGVNVLWLNPVFKSPQVDNGYDVSDYYSIDPRFGNMRTIEKLISEAKKRGLRIILDLVLNHTSDQHHWFLEARKSRDNPFRNFYIWRDGQDGKEPNNWASFFGGSAWSCDAVTGQYYFHLFDKRMPDLNWENPEVRKRIYAVAKFWRDKGIDGFRLDAVIHLAKDTRFSDFYRSDDADFVIAEPLYANLPRVHDFIHEFHRELKGDHPDFLLIGEAASADMALARTYSDPSRKECDCVISFRHLDTEIIHKDPRLPDGWQPEKLNFRTFKKTMQEWQRNLYGHGWMAIYWNNHDMPRLLSRFGTEGRYRVACAKMMATLMYLQWGMPFIFQGEEMGMINLKMPHIEDYAEPGLEAFKDQALKLGYSRNKILKMVQARSKNTSRGSMQWDDGKFGGFSDMRPWLGINEEYKTVNAAEQEKDPDSVLNYYKALFSLRKRETVFTEGSCELIDLKNDALYSYQRKHNGESAMVICNFTDLPRSFLYEGISSWTLLLDNLGNRDMPGDTISLAPYESLVLKKR